MTSPEESAAPSETALADKTAEQVELDQLNADVARIMQHQNAGRLDEAEQGLDTLLATYINHPRLMHYKGLNLCLQGRPADGKAMMERALEFAPEDPVQMTDYGIVLGQSGDLDAARDQFQNAVELAPNYALAQTNLGAVLVMLKDFRRAIAHLKRAIELDGRLLDPHNNLGVAYMQTNQFNDAVEILFKALAIDPQSVQAHTQLAAALFRRERHEAAEHHARRAIELMPQAAEPYLHLGNTLAAAGRIDEAAEAYLKIAGQPPVGLMALSRLIHLRKTTADSPEFKVLQSYLDRTDKLTKEGQSTAHFAAGKAHDDMGDYALAFQHLRQGNDLNNELHPFDRDVFSTRAEALQALNTPALMARCGGAGLADRAPIFIVGMPRSGTTLMDQMFSRHPDVQAGGELSALPAALGKNERIRHALGGQMSRDDLTADDFQRLGEDYLTFVEAEGIRTEHFSDKMPSNYQNIGLIALGLPRAKFLIMRRHPLDCLLSNYMQHFGQNQPFSSNFANLALVYTQFDQMADHWSEMFPDRVRQVVYEDVVAHSQATMKDVMGFVGLDWSDDILDHTQSSRQVNTASVAQVREPIYTRAVERWRRYGPVLADLANELRGHLTAEELEACGAKLDS